VIKRGKDLGFTLETGNPVRIPGELFRQNLDRYIAAKNLVFSLKYFPHAAFADLTGDLIMTKRLSDHEEPSSTPDSRFNAMKAGKKLGLFY
jgi:hypothetical protein